MAHALGQLALAPHALGLAHLLGVLADEVEKLHHRVLANSSGWVLLDDLAQLLHAELHVVEVGNHLAQLLGDVHQHVLEMAEGVAGEIRILWRHGLVGLGVGYEHHHPPHRAVGLSVVELSAVGGYKAQHLAVDVCHVGSLQFLAYVACHGGDVVHQHVHVGEDGGVYALKHIVGRVGLLG